MPETMARMTIKAGGLRPTPGQLRALAAAEAIAMETGLIPSQRMVAARLRVCPTTARCHIQGLKSLGLWRWPNATCWQVRCPATSIRVTEAAEAITRAGRRLTYAAIVAETGLSWKSVEKTVRRLKAKGVWRWVLERGPGPPVVRRLTPALCPISVMPVVSRKYDPTPAEIAVACRTILVKEIGLTADAADVRLAAKAARFGG